MLRIRTLFFNVTKFGVTLALQKFCNTENQENVAKKGN